MVCKKCGKKLKIGEEFCSVCGYYNDPEEEGILDDDYFFDEVEEVDEEDYEDYDKEDIDKDDTDKYFKKKDKAPEENLINRFNVSDGEEDINELYTTSTAKNSRKKMTNFIDDRLIESFNGEDYKCIHR